MNCFRPILLTVAIASFAAVAPAQDALTIGSASAFAGDTVQIPVSLRDVSGTPLGGDRTATLRIRGFAFKVTYSPAASVASISFTRSGALVAAPAFETTLTPPNAIAYFALFANNTSVPITLDAAAPGDIIGTLQVSVSATATTGTPITLTIEPGTAMLSNQAASTTETPAALNLALTNGSISVDKRSTSTAVVSSLNPSMLGQAVTFTASVTSASGSPTGNVQFKDGETTIATVSLSSGQAAFTTSSLNAGSHSITAHYGGDASYLPSASDAVSQTVNTQPFGAPSGVVATALSTSLVSVTWFGMTGVDHYDVLRSINGSGYIVVGSTASTSFNDTAVSPGTSYLYRVRAINGSGDASPDSAIDPATTIFFSDDPLMPGMVIKAVHILELRNAVNVFRSITGGAAATFTDTSLAGLPVRAVHIQELRNVLSTARGNLGLTTSFTDPTLTPASTMIKAGHLQELRNGVK